MQANLFAGADISASGMSAERLRMEVVANNIANASSTDSPEGGPYRRQQVVFSAAMNQASGANGADGMQGVNVLGVEQDQSDFIKVHNPSHPNRDEDGFVLMPNVKLPNEMVDLITASRSYEANLKALTTFKQMIEQTLQLLRG